MEEFLLKLLCKDSTQRLTIEEALVWDGWNEADFL